MTEIWTTAVQLWRKLLRFDFSSKTQLFNYRVPVIQETAQNGLRAASCHSHSVWPSHAPGQQAAGDGPMERGLLAL